MLVVTTKSVLYNFEELEEEAKEQARRQYTESNAETLQEIFEEQAAEYLEEVFPNSDNLKIQYDFSCCQGSGLNIYGEIELLDVLERVKDQLTAKEQRTIEHYIKAAGVTHELKENDFYHYTYSMADMQDYTEELQEELENMAYKNINFKVLEKFSKAAADLIGQECNTLYNSGFSIFYEPGDDFINDGCEANDIYFFNDGTITSRNAGADHGEIIDSVLL